MKGIIATLLVSIATVHCGIVMLDGDFFIDGIFNWFSETHNGSCTDMEPEVYKQTIMAAFWTVQKLNDQKYVPGNTIGLRVHQTCNQVERTYELAYQISVGLSGQGMYNRTLAILGPETSREARILSRLLSSVPEQIRPLQVGFSATAESLNDRQIYSNYFRVIPNDAIQVKAMKAFMKALDWTYLGIMYQDDLYGNDAATALQNGGENELSSLCFPTASSVDHDGSHESIINEVIGILSSYESGDTPPIDGFLAVADEAMSSALLQAVHDSRSNSSDEVSGYRKVPSMLFAEAFPVTLALTGEFSNITEDVFIMIPPMPYIPEFTEFWNGIYPNLTMIGLDCSETCPMVTNERITWQSSFASYAIQATMAAMSVIRLVHKDLKCTGGEVCEALANEPKATFIERMQGLTKDDIPFWSLGIDSFSDIGFEFPNNGADVKKSGVGGTLKSDYDVFRKRPCAENPCLEKIEKVFEYFHTTDTYVVTESSILNQKQPQCPIGYRCDMCKSPTNDGVEIQEADENGSDMYIVGLAPVHTTSDTPLACGGVKNGGFDVAEALKFSTQSVIKDFFPGWRVGIIVIDTCNNPQIVLSRALMIHNQGVYKDGQYRRVPILGYVGGWVSDVTIAIAEALAKLGYVQISYAATSPELSNRNAYPYFMRIIPSDVKQAIAMLEVVRNMGSNLVQILYTDSAYGRGGKDSIIENSERYDICVTDTVMVEQTEDVDIDAIMTALDAPNSPKIIMVFISSFDVAKLINALDDLAAGGYILVASEAWGNRDIIANTRNLKDTITIAVELPTDERLKEHFESLDTHRETTSLWLFEYMQYYFHCFFGWSYDKLSSPRNCDVNDRFRLCTRTTKDCFKVDSWAPFTAWAIEALARGAHASLLKMCNSTSTICDQYRSSSGKVIETIRSLQYNYDGLIEQPMFDDNNDGLIGYTLYQIIMVNGVPKYRKMDPSYTFNASTCDLIKNTKCSRCFGFSQPDPVAKTFSTTQTLQILIGLCVGLIFLLIIICIIVSGKHGKRLVCACEDRAESPETSGGSAMSSYIHPCPDHNDTHYDSPVDKDDEEDSGGIHVTIDDTAKPDHTDADVHVPGHSFT